MAAPSKDTASSTGLETVGILKFDDDVEGQSAIKYAAVSRHGFPAVPIKIASQITSVDRSYPYDGDGLLDGVTDTSHIQLDNVSTGLPGDCTGLLILMTAGTAGNIGSIRRITGHAANRQMTLNRALPTTPAAGDAYVLLVDVGRLSKLLVKCEFSVTGSQLDLLCFFYAWNVDWTGAIKSPIVLPDKIRTITDMGAQGINTVETNYFNGENLQIDALGCRGAKVRAMSGGSTALGGGAFSLWACGS